MKSIIQEAQIFGPISNYSQYIAAQCLKIEQYENYQKRSFRNRYSILTTNGVATLSIPLAKGKNNQQIITDVKISYDENWPEKHLQTIRSAYGKSAYFEYYFPEIEKLLTRKPTFIFDLNVQTTTWAIKKLKLSLDVQFTDEYIKSFDISHEFGQDSLNLRAPLKPKIINKVKYAQVWDEKFDFVTDLSILDLLFCTGPEASHILHKMKIGS